MTSEHALSSNTMLAFADVDATSTKVIRVVAANSKIDHNFELLFNLNARRGCYNIAGVTQPQ